jgi:hypothetical protein
MTTLTVHLKHLNVMVTPHSSLMTREYKSIYWYHRQFTSKRTHMNILLFIHLTSMHHKPVPPVIWRICPVVLCIPPTGFISQQKPCNVDRPPSPTALQYATSKHLPAMVSSLMQQYTALSSTQGCSSTDHHTLSYVQTIPNHCTWLYDSLQRHELAMVHIARALSLCQHMGWLDNIFRGNDVIGIMWFPAKMHVRARFKRDVGWAFYLFYGRLWIS